MFNKKSKAEKEMKTKLIIEAFIDGLTVDKFIFKTAKYTGLLNVSNDTNISLMDRIYDVKNGEILSLDGKRYHLLSIPTKTLIHTTPFRRYEYIHINNYFHSSKSIKVYEEKYQEYTALIKNINEIEVLTYVLFADMIFYDDTVDKNVICKWIEETPYVGTSFMDERFNVLNLITDCKEYTEDDYSDFIELIKKYLKSKLYNTEEV